MSDLDATDRRIINALQKGLPLSESPFAEVAVGLQLTEAELLTRLQALLERGILSRFGPMYNADRLGGHNTLVAMAVPPERFEDVAAVVNGYPEVAHNYERDHTLNMWFVVAAESRARVTEVLAEIETRCGLPVHDLPKIREFHVRLRLEA